MTLSLNPAAKFADESEWILEFLQKLAGCTLTPEQLRVARETGLTHARSSSVSIGSLVTLWTSVTELRDFASALGDAAMPGACSALFDPRNAIDPSPFGRGEGVLAVPHDADDSQLLVLLKLALSNAQGKPFVVIQESA